MVLAMHVSVGVEARSMDNSFNRAGAYISLAGEGGRTEQISWTSILRTCSHVVIATSILDGLTTVKC